MYSAADSWIVRPFILVSDCAAFRVCFDIAA